MAPPARWKVKIKSLSGIGYSFRLNEYTSNNNRRYYTSNQIEIIKTIKFLLKDKGMTINGAKNLINFRINKLDYSNNDGLKADYYKNLLKIKSKLISEKIKKIKKYGKKNSS